MRSTVIGLATAVLSLTMWSAAQAGPLDGPSATWDVYASGTGSATKTITGGGYAASLQVGASAHRDPYEGDTSGTGVIDLVLQIVTPTPYSYSLFWSTSDGNGGFGVAEWILFNGALAGRTGFGHIQDSGVLLPGSYHTMVRASAVCYVAGAPYAQSYLDITLLPEPATLGLFVLGAAGMARRRLGKSSRKIAS